LYLSALALFATIKNMDKHLKEVALLFTKLGFIGFGGPAVHIAMMRDEVVKKRKWFSEQHFLDLVGATNLIPGPNSTEMTMHCGQERAGWKGLVVAGCCFILPAVFITSVFAWAYQQYGKLPQVQPFIYGIKPAIIAIVAAAMYSLGKKALKSLLLGLIGFVAAIAVLIGINEIIVLFSAGAVGVFLFLLTRKSRNANGLFPFMILQISVSHWKLFGIFLKVGAILYGSGYVLFGFLDAELVNRGLITRNELMDAIAVGQFTPGPVFSAATFIGYQIGGVMGAVAATIGIFLPSFLFVGLLNPIIPRLRKSGVMSQFLDTVNVASVAIILAVLVEMTRLAINDWRTIAIASISLVVTLRFKEINSAFIVLGGSVLGYFFSLL
jgi:chromate transporter